MASTLRRACLCALCNETIPAGSLVEWSKEMQYTTRGGIAGRGRQATGYTNKPIHTTRAECDAARAATNARNTTN